MSDSQNSPRCSRRSLIVGIATLPIAYNTLGAAKFARAGEPSGLVVREQEPRNLESDFSALPKMRGPAAAEACFHVL